MTDTNLRTFHCTDDLWERAKQAARLLSVAEERDVSVSELIRRGLEREVTDTGPAEQGKSP